MYRQFAYGAAAVLFAVSAIPAVVRAGSTQLLVSLGLAVFAAAHILP